MPLENALTHALLKTALAATLAAGGLAHAGLSGTQVTLRYDFGAASSTDVLTVGAGPEVICTGSGAGNANACSFLNAAGSTQVVDIGDSFFTYALSGSAGAFSNIAPNAFNFTGLAPGGAITGVLLASNIAGMDASRVSFTASSVRVDMQGLNVADGQGWSVVLQAVPEPGPAALLLAGGALVAWRARRP